MKIRELFSAGRRLFSFEFFPPKSEAGAATLERTIRELADLQPAFVSVTYGAGGTTRDRTVELVTRIQREDNICAMGHSGYLTVARRALVYVLQNHKKHRDSPARDASEPSLDPLSSAASFDGFATALPRGFHGAGPPWLVTAKTWLLGRGWRRHGLIRLTEGPSRK